LLELLQSQWLLKALDKKSLTQLSPVTPGIESETIADAAGRSFG
jgi:hypothetical protein